MGGSQAVIERLQAHATSVACSRVDGRRQAKGIPERQTGRDPRLGGSPGERHIDREGDGTPSRDAIRLTRPGAHATGTARLTHGNACYVALRRKGLAREIHDTVGQLLFGAGVAARAAREFRGPPVRSHLTSSSPHGVPEPWYRRSLRWP